jgi:hypothetical protein
MAQQGSLVRTLLDRGYLERLHPNLEFETKCEIKDLGTPVSFLRRALPVVTPIGELHHRLGG